MTKKLLFIAAGLMLAGNARAEVETVWTHSLKFVDDNVSMRYVSQGDDYSVSMNYSPTYGWIDYTTSVYTMPAETAKQNLLFEVKSGLTIDHLTLQMGTHEYSDQSDGGPDTESYVLFLGYDIDGVRTTCLDTLWNGRNSTMTEHPRYQTFELRDIHAKRDVRLYFDCSHSAHVANPQPDIYTGEVKAEGMVCIGMRSYYDMPAALYERVTSQSQVEPNAKYMVTTVAGGEVYGIASDTAQYNNTYLHGKKIAGLTPEATTYDGSVSVEFETVPDDTGFAQDPNTYFLTLPLHKDHRYSLRTSGLGFYISFYGANYYKHTEQKFDPETETSTYVTTGRTLYADLWELRINDDGTLSMISHEMNNAEGRELQYRADRNYFVYQDEFTYEAPLYLWKRVGESLAIGVITRNHKDTPCFDLQGHRLKAVPAKGAYIQGGKIRMQ